MSSENLSMIAFPMRSATDCGNENWAKGTFVPKVNRVDVRITRTFIYR